MWAARDKDGQLRLFEGKPIRWRLNSLTKNIWVDTFGWVNNTAYGFPYKLTYGWESLDWKDEPVEVFLFTTSDIEKIKKESYNNGYVEGNKMATGYYK